MGGLGSISEGQGQQGRGGGGRPVHCGVRAGSRQEPVSDLESAVVGFVFPAAGESGGDPQSQGSWGSGARGADRGRSGGANGGPDVPGTAGRADLPSGLLRLSAEEVRAGRGWDLSAAVLA